MVAGYRACWQATQMLVHPLMKLARSLKTNSPAQLFFGIFLRVAPCLQTLLDSSSPLFFFPNGLNPVAKIALQPG